MPLGPAQPHTSGSWEEAPAGAGQPECPSYPPRPPGKTCQQADPCASNPCANGGQCLPFEASYICRCPPGFHGPTCRQDVNECGLNPPPCRHGGTCLNEVGSYRCVCRATHTGQHCELPYVPCSPSPCQNGGTCRPTGDTTHECACLPGTLAASAGRAAGGVNRVCAPSTNQKVALGVSCGLVWTKEEREEDGVGPGATPGPHRPVSDSTAGPITPWGPGPPQPLEGLPEEAWPCPSLAGASLAFSPSSRRSHSGVPSSWGP